MRPQAMLEARDLPRNHLSDHLERDLERVLQEDRILRAKRQGVDPSMVSCMRRTPAAHLQLGQRCRQACQALKTKICVLKWDRQIVC